ncbi:MAG: hypothetical protein SPJ83_05295, partial [Helicobacter sp.]|nr:hypothetical protein [Helicobacter sp.]
MDRFSNVLDSKPLQHESFVRQDLRKRVWQENENYDISNPKLFSYKFLDNKEIINMPDFALSDRGRAIKKVVAEEPKQRELIEQINAGQTEKFDEFMDKEREALQALLQHDETTAQRFIDMANMFKDNELKREYFKEMLNVADTIRHHTHTTYPMFEKAYKDLLKEMFPTKPKDIHFTDKKGKEHILTKEVQQQWLDTFNLKSLDDTFIPSIPQEVREAIGKDIKVNFKDLLKLVENGREKYIPQIRETFSKPEAAFIDEQNDLIFARIMTDNLFFVNVSRDYGENFLNVTLSPKKHNTLLNKLKNAKEIFIDKVSPELRDSSAHKASTDFLSSTSRDTQNPTTKQEISKETESKSTQWQQFIHNALPNELKHYEKLSGEQLNKIKEANELDKDIFFSRWHNHPKVLETIKVKTKDNKEVEVLKTLHKDG